MVITLIILAWLGLAFGSFVNALVWRIHEQETRKNKKNSARYSITHGRSMCPHCKHVLSALDLIPVFSWLVLRGRCRYCSKKISAQYPIVELACAGVFILSYTFWPGDVNTSGDYILFITWLASFIGLLALLIYDIRWMLLPNRIIYPTLAVASLGRILYIFTSQDNKLHAILMWALSVLVASGIFWALYVISAGKWIGFGDIRLGFITGTLLASPGKSFLMIFLGSILGTLFIAPALVAGKRDLTSKLPFGPFLIAGCAVALLFGSSILDWYNRILLP
jgi:prepilin signal peptidase PulO-like enzyme (type II secretory pathway)